MAHTSLRQGARLCADTDEIGTTHRTHCQRLLPAPHRTPPSRRIAAPWRRG